MAENADAQAGPIEGCGQEMTSYLAGGPCDQHEHRRVPSFCSTLNLIIILFYDLFFRSDVAKQTRNQDEHGALMRRVKIEKSAQKPCRREEGDLEE
jgi:hypothetical protein